MKKRAFLLVFILCLSFTSGLFGCQKKQTPYEHKPDFDISSEAVFIVDADTGNVIYEKEADKLVVPAALTQMVTAAVTLDETPDMEEYLPVNTELISKNSIGTPLADTKEGEEYTAGQLLSFMLLGSDPDAATVLAAKIGGGDINSFISRLNDRARAMGTTSSTFVNASGEHDVKNYTTARDMGTVAKAVYGSEAYMQLVSMPELTVPKGEKQREITVTNNNRIEAEAAQWDISCTVKGIKYSTSPAGGDSLVFAATVNNINLIAVLMGAPADNSAVYTDAQNVMKFIADTCMPASPPKKNAPVLKVAVAEGFSASELPVMFGAKLANVLPKKVSAEDVTLLCRVPQTVDFAVRKGDVIGSADIISGGEKVQTISLIAGGSVKSTSKTAAPPKNESSAAPEEQPSGEGAAPTDDTTDPTGESIAPSDAQGGDDTASQPAGEESSAPAEKKSGGSGMVFVIILIVILSLLLILVVIRQINIIRYRRKRQRAIDARRRQVRRQIDEHNSQPRPPMQR